MRYPGVIPAVTTPFDSLGHVDATALKRNVAALLEDGMSGFVATGTMGEAGSLSTAERREVVAAVVRAVKGHLPVIAGISAGTAAQAGAYARDAADVGATGLMCLPPLGYRADAAELAAFYADVARATDLPIMLYNNPEASGVDLAPELIVSIAERVESIVAVKECSGDARRIPALLIAAPDLEILVGGDDWALEGFCAGATGWISGVADCAPAACVELYEAGLAADLDRARAVYARLLPLARLDMTPKLVQYFKAAQDALGFVGGPVRPPRLGLTDAEQDVLREALDALRAPEAVR